MRGLVYQIFRWRSFSKIKDQNLQIVTRYIPVIIAVLFVLFDFFSPIDMKMFGDGGLSRSIGGLYSQLPGFFVAALAAVATFDRPALDETMSEPAPTLVLRTGNKEEPVKLTLRMFLSILFAYLSALSLIGAVYCAFGEAVGPEFKSMIDGVESKYISTPIAVLSKATYSFIFAWILAKILLVSMFGMYFLAERIHRPVA